MDHKINTIDGAMSPHRAFIQRSPSEIVATKEYITDQSTKVKTCSSRSPHGTPFFIVKQKRRLRRVIDYKVLNKIIKQTNATFPRTNGMLDRSWKATVYLNLNLKAGSHQIRVKNKETVKAAYKTKYKHYKFSFVPVGLCSIPTTFWLLMSDIFMDVIGLFLFVYLHEFPFYSDSCESYLKHL